MLQSSPRNTEIHLEQYKTSCKLTYPCPSPRQHAPKKNVDANSFMHLQTDSWHSLKYLSMLLRSSDKDKVVLYIYVNFSPILAPV